MFFEYKILTYVSYFSNPQNRNGVYNSFKSPLLQQQKAEEQAKAESDLVDPRLKNIEPKMIG